MKITRIIRRSFNRIQFTSRRINSGSRKLPDFLIVGAQKSGTTSLYSYLCLHPHIRSAFVKEAHYFDLNYDKPLSWYRAFFPGKGSSKDPVQTGEASPQYMFHPHAPERIARDLPGVRLIMLLRNPVHRAYSHYQHQVRVGREKLSFEEAIEKEEERIEGEQKKMLADPSYNSFNYLMYSYLERGKYVDQVKHCYDLFGTERILLLQSEYLLDQPQSAFDEVISFLGLPPHKLPEVKKYNSHTYTSLDPGIQTRLSVYFEPFNRQLYSLTGKEFNWPARS